MFDPILDLVMFLSAAFILGLALGWALWKLGVSQKLTGATSEAEFWQDRLNQARQEHDLDRKKIEALENERANLKKRLEMASLS